MRKLINLTFIIFCISCSTPKEPSQETLFTNVTTSGISFINQLTLNKDLDVFRYRNYYNGGGVAIGDINNDSLPDVYMTANMKGNQLFLNQGDFNFRDITDQAGVSGDKIWSTGVSMADVNGDGLLDIYVCNSGDITGGRRENELFINNGDLTFTDKAEEFGLADKGFSTHAVFFDYDNDGDLDCYVLNNSFRPVSSLGLENIRHIRDSTGGDKLYRNDSNKFIDVSQESGIFGSVIGFGLGVTVTDINLDGWLDLYISNDFFERDYLYVNQKDGTFKDELTSRLGHISQFSMGTDAADINNDGWPDIFVTDMLPATDKRLKLTTNYDSYDRHRLILANDYYDQFMRNTLQLNGSNGVFKEIGQYAGVSATDWSWGTLIADFTNSGHKEIFVTNGVYRDVTDQDFIDFLANEDNLITAMRQETVDFEKLVEKMPSTPIENYMFLQDSSLQFKNVAADWGLAEPSHSNGAAYGDLDNDGDLDLIVNNVNQPAFVYRNNSNKNTEHNFLKIHLKGDRQNPFGVGARVQIFWQGNTQMLENIPTKGFQSSMNYELIFGLGKSSKVDSLIVTWGPDKKQIINSTIQANQTLNIDIQNASMFSDPTIDQGSDIKGVDINMTPEFKHKENSFIDFDRERLIYHMISREGPSLAKCDINGDGLDDFYIGGATGQAGSVYIQQKNGSFRSLEISDFKTDQNFEDVDAIFLDVNNDGLQDLYVVSGGYEFPAGTPSLQDRVYIQKRAGSKIDFTRSESALPRFFDMGACVKAGDFNNDGFLDLFVGGRAEPGKYGSPGTSRILENSGDGKFIDVSATVAPKLVKVGMVTDGVWVDIDNDSDLDLIVVGEWMPPTIFKNNGANLERLYNVPGLVNSNGWYQSIISTDLNLDGEIDLLIGNWGLNSKFNASEKEPLILFINDFDNNGTDEHIFAYYQNGQLYPTALKNDLIKQLPLLKKKFTYFKDYAGKTINEIFSSEELDKSVRLEVFNLASIAVINNGDGSYTIQNLPEKAQFSPIFDIQPISNVETDQKFLLTGNYSATKPEEGIYDSNHGQILDYTTIPKILTTEIGVTGDVKKVISVRTINNKRLLIVAKNNDSLEFYEY